MSDKVFLDTNVLVYAHTDLDIKKQSVAQALIIDHTSHISNQVLQELANVLRRKFKQSWKSIESVVLNASNNIEVHINGLDTLHDSFKIAEQYKFSFYDSLIISAALKCGSKTLYSEDLQHGQTINNEMKIINPFH